MSLDPLKRQILWSRLIAVVEEQSRTLMKVAFSPTVREAGDLSAGLFDAHGRMVAQAVTGTPGHVNAMAVAARHFLAVYPPQTMQDGDHYITNDPWLVSGHLHDASAAVGRSRSSPAPAIKSISAASVWGRTADRSSRKGFTYRSCRSRAPASSTATSFG
jgi:hypothetical protein